jgi:hypothetical protein
VAARWSTDAISDWLELGAGAAEKTAEEEEEKDEAALATPGRPEWDIVE